LAVHTAYAKGVLENGASAEGDDAERKKWTAGAEWTDRVTEGEAGTRPLYHHHLDRDHLPRASPSREVR
jgi:hypothetical protein